MPPDEVARQTPCDLLAPFQGAIRVSWALSGGCTTGSFLACLRHGRIGGCAVIAHLKPSRMASTHLSLHYHLVFSTKNREPWLSPTHRQRVHEYIGGIIRSMDALSCGGDAGGEERVLTLDSRGTAGALCSSEFRFRVSAVAESEFRAT